jgi:hypothetical protein
MSHYTLATPLDTWQKVRDDMVAKGVDPDVALAHAKETPAATGNTPVDETEYKCIFCRDVSGTATQYFIKLADNTLWKATGYDNSTLASADLDADAIATLDATYE